MSRQNIQVSRHKIEVSRQNIQVSRHKIEVSRNNIQVSRNNIQVQTVGRTKSYQCISKIQSDFLEGFVSVAEFLKLTLYQKLVQFFN